MDHPKFIISNETEISGDKCLIIQTLLSSRAGCHGVGLAISRKHYVFDETTRM